MALSINYYLLLKKTIISEINIKLQALEKHTHTHKNFKENKKNKRIN